MSGSSNLNSFRDRRQAAVQLVSYGSVSSTEKDIDTRLTKAWTAINRLSIIWKSDLTDKMKQFLSGSSRIDTAIWMHYMDSNKTVGEEARRQLHKNAANNLEQVLAATPHKTTI